MSTDTLINNIMSNIVNPLITLMIAVAVLYFLYGVYQFVKNADSSAEREKGGQNMLYGVLGFFLMISAYGVVNLILRTIGK